MIDWNKNEIFLFQTTSDHNKLFNTGGENMIDWNKLFNMVGGDMIDWNKLFLYGPSGTEKTYLYKTIIFKLRSEAKILLIVVSSGIVEILLPAGRLARSRFKIKIRCVISHGTIFYELIKKTALIIWDEAPMTHRYAFEQLDRTLGDLMSMEKAEAKDKPFGGKNVLLSGDFRLYYKVLE